MSTNVDTATLPPRELAKELLRHDPWRNAIPDPSVSLDDVVKAIRRGGGGMSGGWPGGYEVGVWGTHIEVARSQGIQHDPPIRFTTYEIVKEMREEATSPATQLDLWSLGRPIAAGDRVRVTPPSRPAYAKPYRDWEGIAVSVSENRTTKVRRWLLDYAATGGWGRYRVREEHLERVEVAAEAVSA